jgi:hypothetical protein
MHALFNANNKHDGREMMKNAERYGAINKQQFGGRKHHQANRAALGKRLILDLTRLQVQAGTLICNDAKSCFDWIIHSAAMFAMARLGLSYHVLCTLFLTLQMAQHHVKTAFGVSNKTYGSTKHKLGTIPMHGLGQGNGIAPACWVAISSVLINMMQDAGYGAVFQTAFTLATLYVVCFSFIDDTDLFCTAPTPDTPGEECIPYIQETLDKWGNVLRATGGALVPGKSMWWLIDFVYRADNGQCGQQWQNHPSRF